MLFMSLGATFTAYCNSVPSVSVRDMWKLSPKCIGFGGGGMGTRFPDIQKQEKETPPYLSSLHANSLLGHTIPAFITESDTKYMPAGSVHSRELSAIGRVFAFSYAGWYLACGCCRVFCPNPFSTSPRNVLDIHVSPCTRDHCLYRLLATLVKPFRRVLKHGPALGNVVGLWRANAGKSYRALCRRYVAKVSKPPGDRGTCYKCCHENPATGEKFQTVT